MDTLATPNMIALISFAGIASVLGAIVLAARDLFGRRDPQEELQRQLKRLPSFRDEEAVGMMAQLDLWLERTVYWSGLNISALEAVLLAVLVALVGAGATYVSTDNELWTALAGLGGVVAVVGYLLVRKNQRLRRFEEQFPSALDLMARGVRAGESVEQAMDMVGEAMRDPVGPEFARCARQLELGLSLAACMRALSRRNDQMDVKIFATTLSVHREAGGNLPITLERLAEVIRDRMSYQRQLKSVTAAGRYSAMLIAAIGPLLFAYLFAVQPQYGGRLMADPLGRILLVVAIVSEIIGLVWIYRLIKSDY